MQIVLGNFFDDLVLIAEILDLLMEKLKLWKDNMENKGLCVNVGKTKVMICRKGLDSAVEVQWNKR